MFEDETKDFWRTKSMDELAATAAVLHRERRLWGGNAAAQSVFAARKTIADFFIKGHGIELGAGDRPFPLGEGAKCIYGDIRNRGQLEQYFRHKEVVAGSIFDGQTLTGLKLESVDFVISAHLIEHLENPIGHIECVMRVLKGGGNFILVVPDMRYTFDRHRLPTPLEHLLRDYEDGGASTKLQAYIEHVRDIAIPEHREIVQSSDIEFHAHKNMIAGMDIHFHAWTTDTLRAMVEHCRSSVAEFKIIGNTFCVNENIFVLQK